MICMSAVLGDSILAGIVGWNWHGVLSDLLELDFDERRRHCLLPRSEAYNCTRFVLVSTISPNTITNIALSKQPSANR